MRPRETAAAALSGFAARVAAALPAALVTVFMAAAAVSAQAEPCRFDSLASARLAGLAGGRSVKLLGGGEATLAGLDMPSAPGAGNAQAASAARGLAQSLIAGAQAELRGPAREPDRYGRLNAFVFVNGSETPLQYTLLARGLARFSPDIDAGPCVKALLAHEKIARDNRLGLWGETGYALRQAHDSAGLAAAAGRFTVVEGIVVSVRESGSMIYVNFGRRWRQALTATAARSDMRLFADAGVALKGLEGRRIRVRGHVEMRGGPVIALSRPAQIEPD